MTMGTERATASWPVLVLAGVATALAVAVGGRIWERARFGPDDRTAAARVESAVRADVANRTESLRRVVAAVTAAPDIGRRVAERRRASRALFDVVGAAVASPAPQDLAVTIYAPDLSPLAWMGRPSTLPADRLNGPTALFVAPGALGLRLVYVEPILAMVDGTRRRVGAVAAERVLSPSDGARSLATRSYRMETDLVPVTVRTRFTGAGAIPSRGFLVRTSTGEVLLEAVVPGEELAVARAALRRRVLAATLGVLAGTILVAGVPLLEWRRRTRNVPRWLAASGGALVVIGGARWLAWAAVPPGAFDTPFQPVALADRIFAFLHRSPFDFLLTSLAVLGVVGLVGVSLRPGRVRFGRWRGVAVTRGAGGPLLVAQVVAGTIVAGLAWLFEGFLRWTIEQTTIDVLHLSLAPWDWARLCLVAGLICLQTAAWWTMVLVLAGALAPWRVRRPGPGLALLIALAWLAPGILLVTPAISGGLDLPRNGVVLALAAAAGMAAFVARWPAVYRRGSQALRLVAFVLAFILPSLLLYPSLLHFAERARQRLVETSFASQAQSYPEELLRWLNETRAQIDRASSLAETVEALDADQRPAQTDEAFLLWQATPLADERLTSAIEIYGARGRLLSRFALNLPEYENRGQEFRATTCGWGVFGEAAPFGAEERRMLHAERGVCDPAGRMVGGLIIHVMPDYSALPFLSSQNPYYELLRGGRADVRESFPGADLGLVIYGWGRTPIYASATRAWSLDDQLFRRIYRSREPFWTLLLRGDVWHHVYVSNDRYAIYLLDYPALGTFDHLVHLTELATLASLVAVGLLILWGALWQLAWHREKPAMRLVREIRTSFYRKLFLATVAAAVVPVVTLAVATRTYVAARLRADVESEAGRTAAVARRVIQESLAIQSAAEPAISVLNDDGMVWLSRVIEQDINIFDGPQLLATSERDLFASGLLPTRVPDAVYRAIVLDRLPSYVGEEEIANLRYLMAAAPVRAEGRDAIMTVPLTLRQREIEREIEELNQGLHLGALVFILLGAGIGFWMAERIGDPVQRLTRASKRIAAGDLDARVFVRSADELKRLVEAFNQMAFELQRQRAQLERTNRLEAWAEMARQVAHDIKNPLTPIQLSAEHLRRVHKDKGEPLSPVLDGCVDTILTQVRLLRQISSEFSSFATTPVARPVSTDVAELLEEVTGPYRGGLSHRVALDVNVERGVPPLVVDRMLVGRAITNVIENALHAMPGGGSLRVSARREPSAVAIAVSDTGVGMDADALGRIFEPYFSTKAIGTGLGLTIAKRNVDLHGGTIEVQSTRGVGTTVTLRFPLGRDVAPPKDAS